MLAETIRELALMGPVDSKRQALHVLSLAARACGAGQLTDAERWTLRVAAFEWLCRSLPVFGNVQNLATVCNTEAEAFLSHEDVCRTSMEELRKTRFSLPSWIEFTDYGPESRVQPMTQISFLEFRDRICKQKSDALCVVLAARILWPEERSRCIDAVMSRGWERPRGDMDLLCSAWNIPKQGDAGTELFKEFMRSKLCTMKYTFLSESIPSVMGGHKIAEYAISDAVLQFKLETADYSASRTEYILSFDTGDITCKDAPGVVFSMQSLMTHPAFLGHSVETMADLLVDLQDARSWIRFDADIDEWRVLNEECGVWRPRATPCDVKHAVAEHIRKQLAPLAEMEVFFHRELTWDECTGRIVPCASSQLSSVKRKRKFGRDVPKDPNYAIDCQKSFVYRTLQRCTGDRYHARLLKILKLRVSSDI